MSDESQQSAFMASRLFARRVALAAAITALFVVGLLLTNYAAVIFFVFFAGALGAVFVDGGARYVRRVLPFSRELAHRVAVVLLVLAVVGALVGAGWLVGPSLGRQFDQLAHDVPSAIDALRERLSRYRWGRAALEQFSTPDEITDWLVRFGGSMRSVMTSAITLVSGALIIVVLAVFYAFTPEAYFAGLLALFPARHHARTKEVLGVVGHALRRWFVGRLVSMTAVGVLTGLGLWLLGIPAAAVLGLIAGLFSFVPNVGPVLSALPGILLGLMVSPMMAVWALLVYVGVQLVDNYLITPFVEQHAVSLPAGLLLSVQLLMGFWMGILGLFIATPLAVLVIVLVQMLYVEGVLGHHVHRLGAPREGEHKGDERESKTEDLRNFDSRVASET